MVNRELGWFKSVVGTAETKGGHELYEGRKGGHGGGGQEEAGWGQPCTIVACRLRGL